VGNIFPRQQQRQIFLKNNEAGLASFVIPNCQFLGQAVLYIERVGNPDFTNRIIPQEEANSN
jgi:hypothetical protein